MSDYSKLKVAELKEELKARGIPLTSLKLKQDFIDKLLEADAAGQTGEAFNQDAEKISDENINVDAPTLASKAPDVEFEGDRKEIALNVFSQAPAAAGAPLPPALRDEDLENKDNPAKRRQELMKGEPVKEVSLTESASGVVDDAQQGPSEPQPEDAVMSIGASDLETAEPNHNQNLESEAKAPSQEVENETAPKVASHTTSSTLLERAHIAQQPSAPAASGTSTPSSIQVPTKELIEDSKKRKRRSLTPPPSSADVAQKKARASDGSPITTKTEVSALQAVQDATDDAEADRDGDGLGEEARLVDEEVRMKDAPAEGPIDDASPGPKPQQSFSSGSKDQNGHLPTSTPSSPTKLGSSSPHKTPDKSKPVPTLLARGSSPTPNLGFVSEDRRISPAIHPATSSLYIRNFKRPLHVPTLRSHLTTLATPPKSSPPEKIMTTFYLDSIRTHAFVSFTSISAASRVRSAFHETRFPDERTRDLLWVDFVPDEKVQKWIDMEADASGGGRGIGQRWEVIYEEGTEGVEAILQEVGSNSSAARKPSTLSQRQVSISDAGTSRPTASTPLPQGIHPDRIALVPQSKRRDDDYDKNASYPPPRAPSYQTTAAAAPPPPPRTESTGTGFRALDDLFPSTVAKPKLYYKPVSPRTAESRLGAIKDLRVGHAGMGKSGDEGMKRYTFEIYRGREEWVDKGPEFGYGRRGGFVGGVGRGGGGGGGGGGAGPRGGGGRGGGGGYRGGDSDVWRGRERDW